MLFRDMAGDVAQNAATRINPSEDQLSQIDKAADDNTWHNVPDMSSGNLKSQIRSQVDKNKPFSRQDARGALGDATQAAHPSGSRDPADAGELAARDQQSGGSSGMDAEGGARHGAQNLRNQASQNVPDETKDRARHATDKATNKTKAYMGDKFNKERREQTIYRLKKMIVEIQGHKDCKSSNERDWDIFNVN